MATIPEDLKQQCHEVTSFDGGFVIGVQCINIPSFAGYASYYRFDSLENLAAAYQSNVDFFGSEANGTSCQTGPAEGEYTIDQVPAGRLMCNEYDIDLIAYWTHEPR